MKADRNGVVLLVRDERHPVHNLRDSLKVIIRCHMRDTVPVHDLSSSKLEIGSVDLATQEVVDSCSTSQNDRLTFNLNRALSETDKVGTDTWKLSVISPENRCCFTYQLIGK